MIASSSGLDHRLLKELFRLCVGLRRELAESAGRYRAGGRGNGWTGMVGVLEW